MNAFRGLVTNVGKTGKETHCISIEYHKVQMYYTPHALEVMTHCLCVCLCVRPPSRQKQVYNRKTVRTIATRLLVQTHIHDLYSGFVS